MSQIFNKDNVETDRDARFGRTEAAASQKPRTAGVVNVLGLISVLEAALGTSHFSQIRGRSRSIDCNDGPTILKLSKLFRRRVL